MRNTLIWFTVLTTVVLDADTPLDLRNDAVIRFTRTLLDLPMDGSLFSLTPDRALQ